MIEVGSGSKKGKDGWLTLDMAKGCDFFWDLRNGLPFNDDSVAKIYSSHFMEHLSYSEGQAFLDECYRALKLNGTFSICVPNARIYIDAYINNKELGKEFCGYAPAFNKTTPIDYVNYIAYMSGLHKYMFDEENIVHILIKKGFRNVRLRVFDPDIDRQDRKFESIYAVAIK